MGARAEPDSLDSNELCGATWTQNIFQGCLEPMTLVASSPISMKSTHLAEECHVMQNWKNEPALTISCWEGNKNLMNFL